MSQFNVYNGIGEDVGLYAEEVFAKAAAIALYQAGDAGVVIRRRGDGFVDFDTVIVESIPENRDGTLGYLTPGDFPRILHDAVVLRARFLSDQTMARMTTLTDLLLRADALQRDLRFSYDPDLIALNPALDPVITGIAALITALTTIPATAVTIATPEDFA